MSRKYNNFRTHFGFVRVSSNEPLSTNTACACCGSSKYHQFSTEFKVLEMRFGAPNQRLGDTVEQEICTKCLHYVFGQNLSLYHTNRRQQHYKKRFKDLHEWCVMHTAACQNLPTLRQFHELLTTGKPFKPELVEHVSRLIFHLRRFDILLQFATLFALPCAAEYNDLRFKIDRAEGTPSPDLLQLAEKYVRLHNQLNVAV